MEWYWLIGGLAGYLGLSHYYVWIKGGRNKALFFFCLPGAFVTQSINVLVVEPIQDMLFDLLKEIWSGLGKIIAKICEPAGYW